MHSQTNWSVIFVFNKQMFLDEVYNLRRRYIWANDGLHIYIYFIELLCEFI